MNDYINICYILAYKDPKYVRTKFILNILSNHSTIQLTRSINNKINLLRYFETVFKLIKCRLLDKPDIYLLGFRGVEIYWIVRLLTYGKPLIYDEFINPYLWFVEEHKKISPESIRAKILHRYTSWILRSATLILSDTRKNMEYSSDTFKIPTSKFETIYVGADETVFCPQKLRLYDNTSRQNCFNIFFYGNFLPLHGIDIILDAAHELNQYPPIKFTIVAVQIDQLS